MGHRSSKINKNWDEREMLLSCIEPEGLLAAIHTWSMTWLVGTGEPQRMNGWVLMDSCSEAPTSFFSELCPVFRYLAVYKIECLLCPSMQTVSFKCLYPSEDFQFLPGSLLSVELYIPSVSMKRTLSKDNDPGRRSALSHVKWVNS